MRRLSLRDAFHHPLLVYEALNEIETNYTGSYTR